MIDKYLELDALLRKSIVSNPLAEIDINTAEQSIDEMASRENPWVGIIVAEAKDHEYGAPPCEIPMPNRRTLVISKVDEGLYSAFLKDADPESGGFGEVLTNFSKMTPEAMVQGLKAKNYLPNNTEKPPQVSENAEVYNKLAEALKEYGGKELHIHVHQTD